MSGPKEIEIAQPLGGTFALGALGEQNASGSAARALAEVQAAYAIAVARPRNFAMARSKAIDTVRRPAFAEKCIYELDFGGNKNDDQKKKKDEVRGLTIKAAQVLQRCWGNMGVAGGIAHEDQRVRTIRVGVVDYEANAGIANEITLQKTVERSTDKGRIVVAQRTNTWGRPVYIVEATEQEMLTKQQAWFSRLMRNGILRLIDEDLVEEVFAEADKAANASDANGDPRQKVKDAIDWFASQDITTEMLEKFLGRRLFDPAPNVALVTTLRKISATLRSGEATWSELWARKFDQQEEKVTAPPPAPGKTPPPASTAPAPSPSEPAPIDFEGPPPFPDGSPELAEWLLRAFTEAKTTSQVKLVGSLTGKVPPEYAERIGKAFAAAQKRVAK